MKTKALDARRLDVARAAADGTTLEGNTALAAFKRLVEEPVADDPAGAHWSARFDRHAVAGGAPEPRLQLRAQARVMRTCQRCLQPLALDLAVDRTLRFAADEQTAAALDADSDDDVLALSRWFDLLELIEDELLLALPLVPMHVQCPQPLAAAAVEVTAAEEPAKPFAGLAALKRGAGS